MQKIVIKYGKWRKLNIKGIMIWLVEKWVVTTMKKSLWFVLNRIITIYKIELTLEKSRLKTMLVVSIEC